MNMGNTLFPSPSQGILELQIVDSGMGKDKAASGKNPVNKLMISKY